MAPGRSGFRGGISKPVPAGTGDSPALPGGYRALATTSTPEPRELGPPPRGNHVGSWRSTRCAWSSSISSNTVNVASSSRSGSGGSKPPRNRSHNELTYAHTSKANAVRAATSQPASPSATHAARSRPAPAAAARRRRGRRQTPDQAQAPTGGFVARDAPYAASATPSGATRRPQQPRRRAAHRLRALARSHRVDPRSAPMGGP